MIEIYTDGGCRPTNPGKGGIGIYSKELSFEYFEGFDLATNNQMELIASIKAFNFIKDIDKTKKIIIITDSNYVVKGVNEWKKNWKVKNWVGVKNVELWKILDKLTSENKNVSFKWIKAHNGHLLNEKADELATKGVYSTQNINSVSNFINEYNES